MDRVGRSATSCLHRRRSCAVAISMCLVIGATMAAPPSGAATSAAHYAQPSRESGCPSLSCTSATSAVIAALKRSAIPGTLSPTLSKAAHDLVPPAGGTASSVGIVGLDPRFNAWTYGPATGHMRIAVIGDSHALQWSKSIAAISARANAHMALLYRLGCFVTLTAKLLPARGPIGPSASPAACQKWTEAAVRWIVRFQPQVVIVVLSRPVNESLYMTGIKLIVANLKHAGRRFAFIGSGTRPWADTPSCLAAHSTQIALCSTKLSVAIDPAQLGVEEGAAVSVGARFVNVIPWLCTTQLCPSVIGHDEVYADQVHLTSTFAASLSPVLSVALGFTRS